MAEAIHIEPRYIEVDGKSYEVRRLNVRDVFTVAKIIGIAIAKGGSEIGSFEELTSQDYVTMLMAAIPYSENDILRLGASLIGVEFEAFVTMPPETLIDIVVIVSESEDLRAFFEKCARFLGPNGSLLNRAQRRSD